MCFLEDVFVCNRVKSLSFVVLYIVLAISCKSRRNRVSLLKTENQLASIEVLRESIDSLAREEGIETSALDTNGI